MEMIPFSLLMRQCSKDTFEEEEVGVKEMGVKEMANLIEPVFTQRYMSDFLEVFLIYTIEVDFYQC